MTGFHLVPVVAVVLAGGGLGVLFAVGVARAGGFDRSRRPRWLGAAATTVAVIGCAATVLGAALLTAMGAS